MRSYATISSIEIRSLSGGGFLVGQRRKAWQENKCRVDLLLQKKATITNNAVVMLNLVLSWRWSRTFQQAFGYFDDWTLHTESSHRNARSTQEEHLWKKLNIYIYIPNELRIVDANSLVCSPTRNQIFQRMRSNWDKQAVMILRLWRMIMTREPKVLLLHVCHKNVFLMFL